MANERDWRVAVVHGCFPEGGDSILTSKRFLLGGFASEAARRLTSFSGQSHMSSQDVHVRPNAHIQI